MRKAGSTQLAPKYSARPLAAALTWTLLVSIAVAQDGLDIETMISGDGIPHSLTGQAGDPGRGRDIAGNRQVGLCILCHSGPFADQRFQGNLAPDLRGAGARWSEAQLRLRIVDSRKLNRDTIMPPYYSVRGITRIAANFNGKTILNAQQIEDIVAWLATLRE